MTHSKQWKLFEIGPPPNPYKIVTDQGIFYKFSLVTKSLIERWGLRGSSTAEALGERTQLGWDHYKRPLDFDTYSEAQAVQETLDELYDALQYLEVLQNARHTTEINDFQRSILEFISWLRTDRLEACE